MKETQKKTTVVSIAALLSLQALPHTIHAQSPATDVTVQKIASKKGLQNDWIKFTATALANQKMTFVGMLKGCPVYQNIKEGFVMMDCSTGDISEVSIEDLKTMERIIKSEFTENITIYIKQANSNSVARSSKIDSFTWKCKFGIQNLKVLGVDLDGHVIQETAKGEQFYLDPATGDMIDFTSHTAFMKK